MCYTEYSYLVPKRFAVSVQDKFNRLGDERMTEGGLLIFLAAIILLCIVVVAAVVASTVSGTAAAIEDDESGEDL